MARSASFTPDLRRVAFGGEDGTVRLADLTTGQPGPLLPTQAVGAAVAFAPDGLVLATGGGTLLVNLWDPASARRIDTLIAQGVTVNALAFSSDGHRLGGGGWDGVEVWDVGERRSVWQSRGESEGVTSV